MGDADAKRIKALLEDLRVLMLRSIELTTMMKRMEREATSTYIELHQRLSSLCESEED